MSWDHYNPVRISAGAGRLATLAGQLPTGPLLLLCSAGMAKRGVVARVCAEGGPWTLRTIAPNPDLDEVDALAAELTRLAAAAAAPPFAAVVALGGGSVIDAGKALAVLLPAGGERALHAHLRQHAPLAFAAALPLFCIPTTAGTGAEVTPFATIWDGASRQKHSLHNAALFPRLALLDPELTLSLPWTETLYSALDAASHALETLWNRGATPVSGALAVHALQLIVDHLPRVQAAADDLDARARLQEASVLAGLAISQNRTALAHSISYPLTARFGVPHGLACSFTLAALLRRVNRDDAWRVALPDALGDSLLALFAAQQLGGRVLRHCTREDVLGAIGEMFNAQRAGNFVLAASADDVRQILEESLTEEPC